MRIHTVPLDTQWSAVFDADTLRIWKIQTSEIDSLDAAAEQADLDARLGPPLNQPVLVPEREAVPSDHFDTLVLHIANCCNLQCEYCYESHSTYLSAPGNMTAETAVRTLDLFYSKYSYIREIKLFGGEPALNQPVIRAVCEHVERLYHDGKMTQKPVYKIITNGTIMNPEFIELIRKYQIKVVFSIDGDAAMHDQLRVYPKKKETFDTIYQNFFLLRSHTDDQQPYSINATYTGVHEAAGITIHDLLWKLSDLFPVSPKKINVHLVTADPSLPFSIKGEDLMLKAAEDALHRAENGDCRTHTRLRAVIRRLRKGGLLTENPCPAAGTWAAVSHTGDLYPCMMFIDRADLFMGNVRDSVFDSAEYRRVQEHFVGVKREDFPCCRTCMANKVCAPCMGINEFETGAIYPRSTKSCCEYRKIVEAAIRGIAEGVW